MTASQLDQVRVRDTVSGSESPGSLDGATLHSDGVLKDNIATFHFKTLGSLHVGKESLCQLPVLSSSIFLSYQ